MDADFADFVRRRGDHHLRTAVLLTGDWHAAEDLVQTSLGKLLAVWDRLDTTAGPDAYLRKIMVNTHRSWWRARWRREIPRAELPDTAGPGDLSEGRVVAEEVRAALRRLPARQRTALVLRFFADLSEAEVAGLMGCSAGSVKAHVHRGLKAMRKLVNRTEDEGSVLR